MRPWSLMQRLRLMMRKMGTSPSGHPRRSLISSSVIWQRLSLCRRASPCDQAQGGRWLWPEDRHVCQGFLRLLVRQGAGQTRQVRLRSRRGVPGTRQRHPMYLTVKTGVNKDGEIVAQKITARADGGAYNSTAPLMITLSCFFIMIPYRLENLSYEGYHVYTNKPVGGAMRGHGIPQARFAIERQLDLIAGRIGIDPVDIRVRNAIKDGEEHPAGFFINTCGFGDSVVEAAKAIGWKEKRGKLPVGRGVGLAGASFPSGVANMAHLSSGAVVQLSREGRVNVLSGAADIGHGAETVICQIVAEQLGVPMEVFKITAADTGTCPLDAGTFGSGVTVRAGNAALAAANDVREQLFPVVAEYLGCEVDDVEAANRKFWVKDDAERSVSLKEILKEYQYSDRAVPIVGRGSWTPPVEQPTSLLTKNGNFSPNYSFMTQAA